MKRIDLDIVKSRRKKKKKKKKKRKTRRKRKKNKKTKGNIPIKNSPITVEVEINHIEIQVIARAYNSKKLLICQTAQKLTINKKPD